MSIVPSGLTCGTGFHRGAGDHLKALLLGRVVALGDIVAEMLERVLDALRRNLKLALAVFVSGDRRLARELVAEKEGIRRLERNATKAHPARISRRHRDSIESSTAHLNTPRDLKRINTHIASVAYPILERRGELQESRLNSAS